MTLKLILAFVIAFAVSAVVGFFLVPYLKRIKAGQSIKENGPHMAYVQAGHADYGRTDVHRRVAVVCLSVGLIAWPRANTATCFAWRSRSCSARRLSGRL